MTCPIGTILRCPTADERRIEYYHSLGMTAMQIAGVMENWLAPTDEAVARSEAIMAMLRERGISTPTMFLSFPNQDWAHPIEGVGLSPLKTRAERMILSCRQMNWGLKYGVRYVTCHVGYFPEESSDEYKSLINDLKLLVRFAKANGQDFLFETGMENVPTLKRIFSIDYYREGVIAQFFYVGVQIMCWTFIIQYGTRVLMNEGMAEQEAEVTSQTFNIIAMAIFVSSRFICTYFLKFINAGALLGILAVVGACLTLGVIFIDGRMGLYCLVAISACMSLMFPTIYGIALQGLGDDAKFGAAGLIMAILGGSVLPPLQATIIDQHEMFGMPAVNVSFVLPLICFIIIIAYGYRTYQRTRQ